MTSILGSSSLKGLKDSSFSIFLIVGKVAMIGVKQRELDRCHAMMIEDC
jgi:hypothetical protein